MSTLDASSDATDMAVEYIRLMTPLLPPGRLAVRISGEPSTAEEHIALKKVRAAASRARAHRSRGLATVDFEFSQTPTSTHLDSPQHFVVTIDSIDEDARRRRIWICLCLGAVFVIVAVLHRRKRHRGSVGRVVVVGEHIYA